MRASTPSWTKKTWPSKGEETIVCQSWLSCNANCWRSQVWELWPGDFSAVTFLSPKRLRVTFPTFDFGSRFHSPSHLPGTHLAGIQTGLVPWGGAASLPLGLTWGGVENSPSCSVEKTKNHIGRKNEKNVGTRWWFWKIVAISPRRLGVSWFNLASILFSGWNYQLVEDVWP